VVSRLSHARRPGVGAELDDPSGVANGFIALAATRNVGHARRPGAGAELNGPSGRITNGRRRRAVDRPLRDDNHHVPLGVVTRWKTVPPPTLNLQGLVHGELRSRGVAGVADRRSDGRQLVTSRRLSSSLQNSLELQLPLQIAASKLLHNAVVTPLIRSLVWELLRVHDEGLYESSGATELGLMILVDFYSKNLGRFFTKNGTDLLRITGAFFEFPSPVETLN
jgi:hypothetical protein